MKEMNYIEIKDIWDQEKPIVQSILSSRKENKILLPLFPNYSECLLSACHLFWKMKCELVAPRNNFCWIPPPEIQGMEISLFIPWKSGKKQVGIPSPPLKVKEVVLQVTIGNYHHYICSHLKR